MNPPSPAPRPSLRLAAVALLAAIAAAVPARAQNIDVRITADNAYRFGFGPISGPTTSFTWSQNIENAATAADIFSCQTGPEPYSVPANSINSSNYLYIVAYADKETSQGVLGQFQLGGNTKIYTGIGPWEVCAVGTDFEPGSGGPSVAQIVTDIQRCNAGNPATTPRAWVNTVGTAIGKLQFGENNGTTYTGQAGDEFQPVCTTGSNGIDAAAIWMWYNWNPATISWPAQSPFLWPSGVTTNMDDEYLIFRLPMTAVPGVTPPPVLDPCCPPWTKDLLKDQMFYQGSGSISAPYTLKFQPTAAFNNLMQAYINYLHVANPAMNAITIDWRLHDQGNNPTALPPYGTQIDLPTVYTTWNWNTTGIGSPVFSNPGFFAGFPMQVGTWYLIHTGIYLENGQTFFPDKCANNEILVRIQVLGALGAKARSRPVLEFSDGNRIIKTVPIQ